MAPIRGRVIEGAGSDDACIREIVDLHRFFEGWLSGALPQTEEVFSRVEQVLASEFTFVGPTGAVTERAALLEWLKGAYGSRPGLRIEIRGERIHQREPVFLATYEEWQTHEETTRGRVSSVLFREADGVPNGLEWLHVHETWPPSAPK